MAKAYVMQVLVAFDQLVNTLTGGWADETLSSRTWRMKDTNSFWRFFHRLVDTLFFFQPNHCFQAFMSEKLRSYDPPELRNG